jgi:hypothetical protein
MRWALVVMLASACAGSSSHAPAWPKQHLSENDGGESLAPHQSHQVAEIGLTKDDDDEGKPAAVTPTAGSPTAATVTATPAATTTTQTPTDETINTEEIIIEIDD